MKENTNEEERCCTECRLSKTEAKYLNISEPQCFQPKCKCHNVVPPEEKLSMINIGRRTGKSLSEFEALKNIPEEKLSWEEEFDNKFKVIEVDGFETASGYFALKKDREKVKNFIKQILSAHNARLIEKVEELRSSIYGDGEILKLTTRIKYAHKLDDIIKILKESNLQE